MADPIIDIATGSHARSEIAPGDCVVPSGRMVWRRAFTGLAEEAPKARAFVRCLLAGTRWVDDTEFATAELINNSLFHSRSGRPGGYFVVEVTRRSRSVRVGVYDLGGGGVPDIKNLPGEVPTDGVVDEVLREHGRGLDAVARLASRVGYRGNPATGHLVWALFAETAPRAAIIMTSGSTPEVR
ncbi:ATP-binding protein [Sphaerisporangium sp. NPDC049002]|uniref:ATP-binding protein n=1 Tax=unclassified Sphaerisporangium TaxID=2630420 RepID=UPI0033ED702B